MEGVQCDVVGQDALGGEYLRGGSSGYGGGLVKLGAQGGGQCERISSNFARKTLCAHDVGD
eukprot:scaffold152008_cov39-Attheya_sp.AAC.2